MEGILGLFVLFADIYAILKIAQSSAETITKAIWILIVLVFPILGVIAWYLAGPGGQKG